MGVEWINLAQDKVVTGFCEHGNAHSCLLCGKECAFKYNLR